jgi:hypothetical protein
MKVVCFHPDVGDEAFVYDVPPMGAKVALMIADQRRRVQETAAVHEVFDVLGGGLAYRTGRPGVGL